MTVYAIACGDETKIGFTDGDARDRLAQLQTGSARPLTLARVWPGGRDAEQAAHVYLAPVRVRGEWFRLTPDALQRLDRLFETLAEVSEGRQVPCASCGCPVEPTADVVCAACLHVHCDACAQVCTHER